MDIEHRLQLFYRRLADEPPARSAPEAFAMICRVLTAIEDGHCPVPPASVPPRSFDGRMYSPQADNVIFLDDGSWWVRTRRHRIGIKPDGSFVIYRQITKSETREEFRKPGASP